MAFYETLKLEKGMYGVPGKSFTQVLEDLDTSENYLGTPLETLDAYQRQLKRFDIRVGGPGSDRVEKFFQSGSAAALFPEYVARAVRQGMEQENLLTRLAATVTKINAMDYRTITTDPQTETSMEEVAEMGVIPQTVIKTKDSLVRLKKRGRMLVTTYEALRGQRLDLFTVTLRQIGAFIARGQAKDAVEVLLKGDDGATPAETIAAAETGKLTYADLMSLWGELDPFRFNTALAGTSAMMALLSIPEFKDANAGMNFQGTGKLVTPLGAELLHLPGTVEKKIIGLDSTCALEMVQADGGVVTDYDKLIDRQLERAAITSTTGFSRIFDGACKVLTY